MGCMPANHVFFTPYVVLKGQTACLTRLSSMPIPTNVLRFEFKTNDSWTWPDENGISKVFGIYWLEPHLTSVRIGKMNGWLWFYVWEKGRSPQQDKRLKGKLYKWETNKTYKAITGLIGNKFIVSINDTTIQILTDYKVENPAGYCLPNLWKPIGHNWLVPVKLI